MIEDEIGTDEINEMAFAAFVSLTRSLSQTWNVLTKVLSDDRIAELSNGTRKPDDYECVVHALIRTAEFTERMMEQLELNCPELYRMVGGTPFTERFAWAVKQVRKLSSD